MNRNLKRLVIAFIYLVLFLSASFFLYQLFKSESTCFDGKRNQGEEGIDCGGPCAPCETKKEAGLDIQVKSVSFIKGSPQKYDVLAEVENPNNQFGSSSASYKFILYNSQGKNIGFKEGSFFIFPSETKYVSEIGIESQEEVKKIEFKINNVEWQEFIGFEKPRINIYNKRFNMITSGTGYCEAYGLLRNESLFDFNLIKITVILRDGNGELLALNSTDMRTVSAGEERDFRLVWSTSFPGNVEKVEMETETGIFSSENFMRKYLPEREFQKYFPTL